jgi:hypothetical protein
MSTADTFSLATVEALARAFAVGLRRELSLKVLAEIDAANAEGDPDACASHEWLDANEVMDDAFAAVTGYAYSGDRDADLALLNAAWTHARTVGYAVLAREVP